MFNHTHQWFSLIYMFWSKLCGEYITVLIHPHIGHPGRYEENHNQVPQHDVCICMKSDISWLTGGPQCMFRICISTKYNGFVRMRMIFMMIMMTIIMNYHWFSDKKKSTNLWIWSSSICGCNMSSFTLISLSKIFNI